MSSPFDEYLGALPKAQQAELQKLRRVIQAVVPEAEEAISYQLPAFRFEGKPLVALGASKEHCALYPLSGTVLEGFEAALAGFSRSKGTVRFTPEAPLPDKLVRAIVEARVAENRAAAGAKTSKATAAKKAGAKKVPAKKTAAAKKPTKKAAPR